MQALRPSGFYRPRVQIVDNALRPTRAEIDLEAVAANLAEVERVGGGARVLAVVKADAYGHGVVQIAERLDRANVYGFGVALAEEGLELRAAGIRREILVLNGVYGGAHREVLDAGLTAVVYDLADIEAFHRASRGLPFDVHIKIDTGMARLGVPLAEVPAFLEGVARFPGARIAGAMTHLAAADDDDAWTAEQLAEFRDALWKIRAAGHKPSTIHAANTAGTFRHPDARFGMVRPGLALFGYGACGSDSVRLVPAMRLRSEIIALRDIKVGARVGYNGTFRASRPTRIATVPVGYGDGLLRALSSRAEVLVAGRRCPIAGRVSMDLTTIDVTDVPEAHLGSEVVLLGQQGDARIGAEELAKHAGTIAYEVLTNISRRVPRIYR